MSEISVSVNGEGVASGVRVIKGNLKSLDADVKRTFSLFEQFNTGLKGIASTNLNTVIKNLDKFNNVMKLMNATNYSNVASGLSNLSNALSTIGKVSFGNVSADMKALSKSIIAVDKIEFNRVAAGVRELKTGLELMGKTSISKASSDLAVLEKSLKGLAKADYDLVSLGVKEISSSLKILSAVNFSAIVADLEKFNQSLSSIKGNKLSGTIRDLSNSTKVLTTTLANQTKSVINSSNALAKYESKVASTSKANHAFVSSVGSSTMGLGLLNTAIIAVTTNLGAREVIAYADSWKQVTNLVKLATTSESDLVATRQRLIAISLDTRTDLSAQATLYNRLNIAQKELGVSSSEIMSVIHNVGRALGVTSTSALEARGALIQLSQAFGQDIVRAEEFNSIMEGTPKVARAIADGMGVSIAQLRKLVLAGVVTNKEIFNSLQSQGTELKIEYEKVEKTISGAFTNLKTAVTVAIGNLDDGTGASKRFADSIVNLSNMIMNSNLDAFAKDIESAGTQIIAILALVGVAKGAGGLIGSIYALNTALAAAETRWLQLNIAMKSNLVVMGFLAAYMAAGYLDKKFGETFGIEAATNVAKFEGSIYKLQETLKETEKAGGNADLVAKILGKDPKKLESSLNIVNTEISKLKKELTSFKKGDVPMMQSQIPAKEADLKRLQDLVDGVNKLKTANQQAISAEVLANEKRAESAMEVTKAEKAKYIEWDKVKDKTLEAIRLGKQADDLLVKPKRLSSETRAEMLALSIAGNEALKLANKLLPEEAMRRKELGNVVETAIDRAQREISANSGLVNSREALLKAQVSQGERLKNLVPNLEEMAGTGNLKAVELLKQYKVEIDKAANAASILEKEFGNASTGMSIETNTLIRETNQLAEAMKEIEKSDLKGLKLKGFLPDLEEAVAGGSTRAIEILKELEAQIKITDAAHAAFVAEYKQAPDTDEEKTLKKLKEFKKELPGALEMIEKLKTFQEEGYDILPALEEADLQGYTSANALIVDLKNNLELAAEKQAALEKEFGAVQTDPMEKQIQNLKDYIKEVQKSEKIIQKLKDMQYSFADSMENFESGNEYSDSLLKSGLAIIDMLKKQQEEEKKLADLRLKASETTDLFQYLKLKKEINEVEADGPMKTLSAYQNLFGTLSSLAKENSKEQQALHNVQMAFAIAEMAMNAKVALTTGVEGVLTQFKGDPYTAFARVAAAAASVGSLLAMIGVSFSGFSGGSGGASTPVKATYQTGTVLGDSSASSESVSNIVEMLDDIHADEYHELQGIYSEMKELNSNITGLVSSLYIGGVGGFTPKDMGINTDLVQSTFADINDQIFSGIQDSMDMLGMKFIDPLTSAVTGFAGEIGNFIVSGLFGGGTKQEVFAQGLTTESAVSIRDLISGAVINAQKYASGETVTDRGWGRSDDRDPYRNVLDIGDTEEQKKAVDNLFTDIFTGLGETFVKIAGILGADVKTVQDYAFQIGDIDLKNLETGSEISEALNAAISTISDEAATELFGKLIGQYQTVGEGMVETAVRVASEKIIVLETVDRLGSAFKDANVSKLAIEFSQSLLKVAGGLESFTEAASTYYDKFFTDEEKQVDISEMLTESLKDFKIDLPNTREIYRDVVEGLDLTTESGQKAYIQMLKLSGSADEYYSFLEDADEKAKDVSEKAKESLDEILNIISEGIDNILVSSGRLSEKDIFDRDFKDRYKVLPSSEHSKEAVDFITTATSETIIALANEFGVTVSQMLQDINDEAKYVLEASNQAKETTKNIADGINSILVASNRATNNDVFKKSFSDKYGVTPGEDHSFEAVSFITTATEETIINLAKLFNVTVIEMLQDIASEAAMVAENIQTRIDLQMQLYKLLKDDLAVQDLIIQQRNIELSTMTDGDKVLQIRVWDLQDEADRVAKANAILESKLTLETQLYTLLGDDVKLKAILAEQRKMELVGIDESSRATQERVWLLQDEADAVKKANEALSIAKSEYLSKLEEEVSILENDLSTARSEYISSLESEISLLESAFESAKSAYISGLENEISLLDGKLDSAKSTYLDQLRDEASAQEELASAIKSAIDSVQEYRDSLFELTASPEDSKSVLLSRQSRLTNDVMSGNTDSTGDLISTSSKYLEVSQASSKTGIDYKRDVAKTNALMAVVQESLKGQMSEAEKQAAYFNNLISGIESITESVTTLTDSEREYQEAKILFDKNQLELELAQFESVLTIEDLRTAYYDAKKKLDNNWYTAELTQFQEIKSIETLRTGYYTAKQTLDNNWYQQEISSLQEIDRSVDALRAAYLAAEAASRAAELSNDTVKSDVSMDISSNFLGDIPHFAAGGYHSGGLAFTGEHGVELAYHQPSQFVSNRDLMSELSNKAIVAELRSLRSDLAQANFTIAKNTLDTAKLLKKFDYNGIEVKA